MIVKVQLPLVSNEDEPSALCYDESREFSCQMTITDDLREIMAGRPKAFFEADVYEGAVALRYEVEDPGW